MPYRNLVRQCVCVSMLFASFSAHAHHTAGHGGSPIAFSGLTGNDVHAPKTLIGIGFAGDVHDEDLGYQLNAQLYGEYAITPRIGVGAYLPFQSIRDPFRANTDGISDMVFTMKGVVWESPRNMWGVMLSNAVSLPTGNASAGRGGGKVAIAPGVTVMHQWEHAHLFASTGVTTSLASAGQPTIDYVVGGSVNLKPHYPMLDLCVHWQGHTIASSSVFTSGSSKGFVSTAVLVQWNAHWRSTIGGRVSVLDTLSIRPDVTIGRDAAALLLDVKAGGFMNVEFLF